MFSGMPTSEAACTIAASASVALGTSVSVGSTAGSVGAIGISVGGSGTGVSVAISTGSCSSCRCSSTTGVPSDCASARNPALLDPRISNTDNTSTNASDHDPARERISADLEECRSNGDIVLRNCRTLATTGHDVNKSGRPGIARRQRTLGRHRPRGCVACAGQQSEARTDCKEHCAARESANPMRYESAPIARGQQPFDQVDWSKFRLSRETARRRRHRPRHSAHRLGQTVGWAGCDGDRGGAAHGRWAP